MSPALPLFPSLAGLSKKPVLWVVFPTLERKRRKFLWFAIFELDLWTVLEGNARRTKSVFYGFVLASVAAFVGSVLFQCCQPAAGFNCW